MQIIQNRIFRTLLALPIIISLVGCAELPGDRKTQGAVIGGAAGAATGAAIGGKNRVLGAIIGGVIGAGGGYVIASKTGKDATAATEAAKKAEQSPATPDQARAAATADINSDGFVTMDEVVALKEAGLSDQEMIQKLQSTDQEFELTQDQQQYLRDRGVSESVIQEMAKTKQQNRETKPNKRGDVIGRGNSTTTP